MMRSVAVIFLGVVALSGCVSDRPDASAFERDGIRYGVTRGQFRGRWWNYYERGRSFQDGLFLAEAERDLRFAVGQRNRDQLWARTYGMHFMQEYFPHRELGVTYFLQERDREAIEELEASLSQRYSARAAYFLDEARSRLVLKQGKDRRSPSVALLDPPPGEVVFDRSVTLSFRAEDDTFVRAINVNGDRVLVDASSPEIAFQHDLLIEPGANDIRVAVRDIVGNTTEEHFTIEGDFDGPAIGFDALGAGGRLAGTIYDPSGVKTLRIDGLDVPLVGASTASVVFETRVSLPIGPEGISFLCEDAFGNRTKGRISGDGDSSLRAHGLVEAREQLAFAGGDASLVELVSESRTAQADSLVQALRFFNVAEGARYLLGEIVVGLDIRAEASIRSLTLNGVALTGLLPNRNRQRVTRRIRLDGEGSHLLVAELRDADGRVVTEEVTIERVLNDTETPDRKLSLALLGNVWEQDNAALPDQAEFISDSLARTLGQSGRFRLVDRKLLPEVLQEQELIAALGSRQQRTALSQVIPADMFLIGKLRRDAVSLEIVAKAVSTETAEVLAYIDVSGPADSPDDLDRLVADLALLLTQTFPRVVGDVASVARPNRIYTTLSEEDRVSSSMKVVIFREGPEIIVDGVSLGRPQEVLAEGIISDVQRKLSTVDIVGDVANGQAIEVNDRVFTK